MSRRPRGPNNRLDELSIGLASNALAVLTVPVAGGNGGASVQAANVRLLGSYNWLESSNPTIAVPGHPTVWTNPTLPVQLRGAPGAAHFDENIARKCGFPLEPVLRAIALTQASLGTPNFKLSDERIDIVTNRNNLRKLFQFASGSTSARDHFRIDAQLAPNRRTLVLTRYEPDVAPRNGRNPTSDNYDHMFERAASAHVHPVLEGTDVDGGEVQLRPVGYHRIVRYDILGMRLLVRSRVDSMLNETTEPEVDELAQILENTHLRANASHPRVSVVQVDGSNLRHVLHGENVPQDKVMDIKTIRAGQGIYWNNVYPQLFLSQTPILKVASRSGQSVTELETHTIDTLTREHDRHSEKFRALVGVLGQMRQIMQERAGPAQPVAFVHRGTGGMLAYNIRQQGAYLSEEGLEMF